MNRKTVCKTVFISIKVTSHLFFFCCLIIACQTDKPGRPEPSEVPVQENHETSDSEKEKPRKLTDKTAREFLKEYGQSNQSTQAVIHTPMGDIQVKLYEDTPLHRANFLYLTEQGYYNDTWFHRVSSGHVIQAGNTDERATVKKRARLGDYHLPDETGASHLHQRGALAAARSYKNNPHRKSDPYEFYIVLGQTYSPARLKLLAEKEDFKVSGQQLNLYERTPGAPHLDGEHTVFGQVIGGMNVVDSISQVKVDSGEWPYTDLPITIEIIK